MIDINGPAWIEAVKTEMYSHTYSVLPVSFERCHADAEAGDPVAQMIMAKYVEVRLRGK